MPSKGNSGSIGRGQGGGRGSGRRQGGGRGMRRGDGRGMGRGIGRGCGDSPGMRQGIRQNRNMEESPDSVELQYSQPYSEQSGQERLRPEGSDQEIELLKIQADTVTTQLQNINTRISELREGEMSAPSNVAYVKESNKISNETRSIRTVAVVHENECVGCGVCAEVCPEGAIAVDDLAVIDIQKCTACGACMYECPQNAISLTELKEVAS